MGSAVAQRRALRPRRLSKECGLPAIGIVAACHTPRHREIIHTDTHNIQTVLVLLLLIATLLLNCRPAPVWTFAKIVHHVTFAKIVHHERRCHMDGMVLYTSPVCKPCTRRERLEECVCAVQACVAGSRSSRSTSGYKIVNQPRP